MERKTAATEEKQNRHLLFKIGIALLILWALLWVLAIIIPFTPVPVKIKAFIVGGVLVGAKAFFFLGVLLVGQEVVNKYKRYLNPKNWGELRDKARGIRISAAWPFFIYSPEDKTDLTTDRKGKG